MNTISHKPAVAAASVSKEMRTPEITNYFTKHPTDCFLSLCCHFLHKLQRPPGRLTAQTLMKQQWKAAQKLSVKESLVYFYWLAAQIKLRHCRARTLQTHFSWWVVALRSTSSTSASQSTGTKRLEEDDLRSGGAHREKKAAPVPANLSLILPQCHAVLLKTTCSRAHIWAPGPTARRPAARFCSTHHMSAGSLRSAWRGQSTAEEGRRRRAALQNK